MVLASAAKSGALSLTHHFNGEPDMIEVLAIGAAAYAVLKGKQEETPTVDSAGAEEQLNLAGLGEVMRDAKSSHRGVLDQWGKRDNILDLQVIARQFAGLSWLAHFLKRCEVAGVKPGILSPLGVPKLSASGAYQLSSRALKFIAPTLAKFGFSLGAGATLGASAIVAGVLYAGIDQWGKAKTEDNFVNLELRLREVMNDIVSDIGPPPTHLSLYGMTHTLPPQLYPANSKGYDFVACRILARLYMTANEFASPLSEYAPIKPSWLYRFTLGLRVRNVCNGNTSHFTTPKLGSQPKYLCLDVAEVLGVSGFTSQATVLKQMSSKFGYGSHWQGPDITATDVRSLKPMPSVTISQVGVRSANANLVSNKQLQFKSTPISTQDNSWLITRGYS